MKRLAGFSDLSALSALGGLAQRGPSGGGGGGGFVAPPVAHTISGSNSNGTTSAGIDTTGATFIVIASPFYESSPAPTISDSYGNTWTKATAYTGTGLNSAVLQFFYCYNPTVGAGDTFTSSGAVSYSSLAVLAFSGSTGSGPVDQQSGNDNGFQTGSITPRTNNQLVVTAVSEAVAGDISSSIDPGFTITDTLANSSGNYFGIGLAYLIQTTATAENPTWSGSVGGCNIASFPAA